MARRSYYRSIRACGTVRRITCNPSMERSLLSLLLRDAVGRGRCDRAELMPAGAAAAPRDVREGTEGPNKADKAEAREAAAARAIRCCLKLVSRHHQEIRSTYFVSRHVAGLFCPDARPTLRTDDVAVFLTPANLAALDATSARPRKDDGILVEAIEKLLGQPGAS